MAQTVPVPMRAGPAVQWFVGLLDAVGSQPIGATLRQCPNPDHGGDTHPSLSLSERDSGAARLHCFAGCPEQDILAALGVGLRQLFEPPALSPQRFAAAARLKLEFPPVVLRRGHPAARGFRLESVHVYSPAARSAHRIAHHRLLRWRLPSNQAKELEWETTLTSGRTVPGLLGVPERELPLYLEQDARAATVLHRLPGHPQQAVLIVESESSVDWLRAQNARLWVDPATAALTNWCATTWAGGAGAVNTERLAAVLGGYKHTVLIPDVDPSGLSCLRAMLAAGLGPAVLIGQPGEDARDLHRRLGPSRFAAAIEHALDVARAGTGSLVTVAATHQPVEVPTHRLDQLIQDGSREPPPLGRASYSAHRRSASTVLASYPTVPAATPGPANERQGRLTRPQLLSSASSCAPAEPDARRTGIRGRR